MNTSPQFSIIVPVYNKAKTLHQCVNSVLAQQFEDWELLLINDGSKDDSAEVCKLFTDARIRYLEHKNHGVSYTRNRGIREAKGTFIVFLDADDYWDNTYLEDIAQAIESKEADIYFTGITKIDTEGHKHIISFPLEGFQEENKFRSNLYSIQRETQLYGYVPNKIVKREFLLSHNLFFDETIRMAEDLEFFLRCYEYCHSFFYVPTNGYYYILYTEGTSMYNRNVDYFSLIDIQKKLYSFCEKYLTSEDNNYYYQQILNLSTAAIREIEPKHIGSLPQIVKKLLKDKEVAVILQKHKDNPFVSRVLKKNFLSLQIEVFCYQLYIRTARTILRLCRK